MERTRRLLGDFDVDHHLIAAGSFFFGDVDSFEVAELIHQCAAVFELGLIVEVAFADSKLSPDDGVARLRVAADVEALDVDQRPSKDVDGHVDQMVHLVEVGARHHLHQSVSGVAVGSADSLDALGDLAPAEPVARLELHHLAEHGLGRDGLHLVPGAVGFHDVELANSEPWAFFDRNRDVDVGAVGRELYRRAPRTHHQEALVVVPGLNPGQVFVEGRAAELVSIAQEREHAGLVRLHDFQQLRGRELFVADEADAPHFDLGAFVDLEHDVDLVGVAGDAPELVPDIGQKEALFGVELPHRVGLRLDIGHREDRPGLEGDRFVDVVLVDLVVAFVDDLANRGPFDEANRELDSGADRVGFDLEVVEVRHVPERFRVPRDRRVKTRGPSTKLHRGSHVFGIDAARTDHHDAANFLAVTARARDLDRRVRIFHRFVGVAFALRIPFAADRFRRPLRLRGGPHGPRRRGRRLRYIVPTLSARHGSEPCKHQGYGRGGKAHCQA